MWTSWRDALSSSGIVCQLSVRLADNSDAATGMVTFKVGLALNARLVAAQPHEKICGMPVEDLFERLSDEVTLPNSRPRNSP